MLDKERSLRGTAGLSAWRHVRAGANCQGLSTGLELGERIGWPMSAEAAVTHEPIGEELGVRLLYTVGRSITPWLAPPSWSPASSPPGTGRPPREALDVR